MRAVELERWLTARRDPNAPAVVIDRNSGVTFTVQRVIEEFHDDGLSTVWIEVEES